MVSDKKRFTGLLELIQIYKQNILDKFFIFTTYKNYTLALKCKKINFIMQFIWKGHKRKDTQVWIL